MKPTFIFLVTALILTLTLLPLPSRAQDTDRPKIGIMKFEVAENVDPAIGTFLYSALMDEMVKSGKFTVVDWEEIGRVLKYIEESQPNISQDEARRQAISQLGIQRMYVGSVLKIGTNYQLAVKALNLDLSVYQTERDSVSGEDALEASISNVARFLVVGPTETKRLKEEERKRQEEERRRQAAAAQSAKAKQQETEILKLEREAWQEVLKNKTAVTLKAFLAEFPDGVHADEAKQEHEKVKILSNTIAGRWRLETQEQTSPATTYTIELKYHLMPTGQTLEIHQSGSAVSFDGLVEFGKDLNPTFYGSYDSGLLKAETPEISWNYKDWFCQYTVQGYLDESAMTISGTVNYTFMCDSPRRLSTTFTMTRLDPDEDPANYADVTKPPAETSDTPPAPPSERKGFFGRKRQP